MNANGYDAYTALAYSEIEGNSSIPQRTLNGGLYTGEPFSMDAPWGNVPIVPESHVHTQPYWANMHIPGGHRAGNNHTSFPNYSVLNADVYPNIQCTTKKEGEPEYLQTFELTKVNLKKC